MDGTQVTERHKIYLMLNKPRGVVTTASDEKGRAPSTRAWEKIFPGSPQWAASTKPAGLASVYQRFEMVCRILAPESHLDKTYHVQVGEKIVENMRVSRKKWKKESEQVTAIFCALRKPSSCAMENATPGWKLCWTKARIATSAACWKGLS